MAFSKSKDSKKTLSTLTVGDKEYHYFSLKKAEANGLKNISRLPYSLKVLLENLLRWEDGKSVTTDDIEAFSSWVDNKKSSQEIAYHPARVLMQDFTGVPAVVDLAAMRDAMKSLGAEPTKINPLTNVDLVIDHSVSVEEYASKDAFKKNVDIEFQRNDERYKFLKWGQGAFENFRVVPPGTGICHQVNLEYLAQTIWTKEDGGKTFAYPDTLVGTDSHTTMINALSVLGWGVGGIEAEAAMLGQAVTMMLPEVVGFRLEGELPQGATATDLVLRVVEMLRAQGVVGKFVEFYGPGMAKLSLADRATLSNMAPEYGATCGFFPIDRETINYLTLSARDADRVALVEAYAKEQGLWRDENSEEPVFTESISLDLKDVVPAIAGPKRPQDRIALSEAENKYRALLDEYKVEANKSYVVKGTDYSLSPGHVVVAAITSCTNTSNPSVMIGAGLVAKKAHDLGLKVKPWVKTSLAPGSQVVTEYLTKSGLQSDLDALGFHLVGYGCTTCIGNSGPLKSNISEAIDQNDMTVASVLSGNRNFEGRISPQIKTNYLASPPLVVAYALAGSMIFDFEKNPLGQDKEGKDVYLKDLWPTHEEISSVMNKTISPDLFKSRYADVFKGPEQWQNIETSTGMTYSWDSKSTYVKNPPFFEGMTLDLDTFQDIEKAYPLAVLGDSVTTDHISPAGAIKKDSIAGTYLLDHGIDPFNFNSFGSRRGNHEVMMRGTFGNVRLKNLMLDGVEGGFTRHVPSEKDMSIYEASMLYQDKKTPLVVIAGKEYGTGSSRDWAAKGTALLGVKAVVAESYERIHRSNLIGMGVLPLQFADGQGRAQMNLTGKEQFSVKGFAKGLTPRMGFELVVHYENGEEKTFQVSSRIDTEDELSYYKNSGILHYVLRNLARQ